MCGFVESLWNFKVAIISFLSFHFRINHCAVSQYCFQLRCLRNKTIHVIEKITIQVIISFLFLMFSRCQSQLFSEGRMDALLASPPSIVRITVRGTLVALVLKFWLPTVVKIVEVSWNRPYVIRIQVSYIYIYIYRS